MKLSCIVACAVLSNFIVADEIMLNPATISQKLEKSLLDEPTKVEIVGKGTILENGDIAKSFLNVSGFSMERKGGGGSEIYYRSQTAARLPVMTDGSMINGGCGMRMDTPITYIAAQNYNSVRIVKGPQDVRFGGLISGGIFFDRDILRLDKTNFSGNTSLLGGSFGRFEAVADAVGGNELGSITVSGGHYKSNDYKDGSGNKLHTKYKRDSASITAALTPTQSTAIQLSADFGKGEAAYADRMRDGIQFDRQSYGLKFEQGFGEHKFRLSSYYHEIDHIMDNFTMRPVVAGSGKGKGYSISHPIREIYGARAEVELNFNNLTSFIGAGYNKDEFKWRGAGNGMAGVKKEDMQAAISKPHTKQRRVTTKSIFTQNEYITDQYGLFGGVRLDKGKREILEPTQKSKSDNLVSGFFRYEKYLNNLTLYAGLGHAQRLPDHWETSKDTNLKLKKEKNTQLDFGAVAKDRNYELSSNFFISKINDYILLNYNAMGMSMGAFNTDALIYGGEVDGEILLDDLYKLGAGVSYVYGKNLKNTNGLKNGDALPKISPLTLKLTAGLEKPTWFVNANFYANAAQTRAQKGYGDVGGVDLGKSDSFFTLGLNAGYKFGNYQILAAVENLNDAKYSYHSSKGGYSGGIAGYETIPNNTRLYEPGRSFWIKFKAHF
jgi:nitrilase/cyanide hydratase and apolipoprotein N-acyltransferase